MNTGKLIVNTSTINQANCVTVLSHLYDSIRKKNVIDFKTDSTYLNSSDCSTFVSGNNSSKEYYGMIEKFAPSQSHYGLASSRCSTILGSRIIVCNEKIYSNYKAVCIPYTYIQ